MGASHPSSFTSHLFEKLFPTKGILAKLILATIISTHHPITPGTTMNFDSKDIPGSPMPADIHDIRQLTRRLRILKRRLFLEAVAKQDTASVPVATKSSPSATSSGAHRLVKLAIVEAPATKLPYPYHPTPVTSRDAKVVGPAAPRGGIHKHYRNSGGASRSPSRSRVSVNPRRA